MTTKPGGVRTTHREYDEFIDIWETVSDVERGQRAIHAKGARYLPKLRDEQSEDYKARLARSDFFNAFWRTVSGLTGMAFRVDPIVEVPAAIKPMLDDVTLAGVSLDALAKDMVEDVLEYGRLGLLVDYPPLIENVTAISAAVAEGMGQRPTIQAYGPKSIINWRYARIGNAWKLAMVVLKEEALIEKSEFETEIEARYRVLDLTPSGYRQRVFRINDKGEDEQVGDDVFPLMNGRTLTEIPFTFVGANGKAAECDDPPLIDLIDANLAHYQINSDYRHGLHFAGLPTLFLAGVRQEEGAAPFYIGGSAAITSDHPDADGKYIEFTGQGLTAIEAAVKAIEQRMAILGARMIADETAQVETLGATQIKRTGENSVMAAIVGAVSEALEWALDLFSQWAGASGNVAYRINRRFAPAQMSPQELTALIAAWQQGAISEGDLFNKLQEGEVIVSSKSLEDHQAEVDVVAMPRPAAAA